LSTSTGSPRPDPTTDPSNPDAPVRLPAPEGDGDSGEATTRKRAAETEHEIIRLVWQELGEDIYVVYADRDPDHLIGTLEVASKFAADVGLTMEQDARGSVQWGRPPPALPAPDTPPGPAP
jgi:hypothetical protein